MTDLDLTDIFHTEYRRLTSGGRAADEDVRDDALAAALEAVDHAIRTDERRTTPDRITLVVQFDDDTTRRTATDTPIAKTLAEQLADELTTSADLGGPWTWTMADGSDVRVVAVELLDGAS